MAAFDDPDELSVALFSEMANQNNLKVVQDFTTEPGAVATAAEYLGNINFDIYNPTFCSSVFKAFHQGVTLCKERSKDQSLDPRFRNLPRMIVAMTDGKEAVIEGRELEFMAFEDSLGTLTKGNIPCYIIGCGELVDWDPDRRVVAADEMSQFAEASQGAFCLTTGPGAVASGTSMFEKIENNFDKIIASHKYLYKISFTTNDESINTDVLRETSVKVGNVEGKGSFLPPVVVNEDENFVLSYPVSPDTTPPPAAFIPESSADFSNLREPHIRYGVTISPFGATEDETRRGKLIGAFAVYVRDTTPPNISFGIKSRDINEINEIILTENPGSDSTWDVKPDSLPRKGH
jgi:hypothetical protein